MTTIPNEQNHENRPANPTNAVPAGQTPARRTPGKEKKGLKFVDVLFVLGCFFAFYTFLGAGTNGGVLSCVILSVSYVPKLLDSWMRRFYKELSAMSADSYRNNLLLKKMVEHHTTPISKEEATHETQVA